MAIDIEELIKAGLFRDMRCPKCNSRNLTTIGVFGEVSHKCTDCGNICSDDEAVSKNTAESA